MRITLGTEGHGLYSSTPQSEEAVLAGMGIKKSDLKSIAASDQAYVLSMEAAFSQQHAQPERVLCAKNYSLLGNDKKRPLRE